MQPNNMWTNFLRRGSLAVLFLLFSGCNYTIHEWVIRGEWYYVNQSSHELYLEGAISDFTTISPDNVDFRLLSGDSFCIEFNSDGPKSVPPEVILCPFIDNQDKVCRITVDGEDPVVIEQGVAFLNRDNYQVEKLGSRRYRFTYTFTDENLAELMQ